MADDTNSDSSYGLIASATRDPVGLECLARPSAAPIRTSEKWWFDDLQPDLLAFTANLLGKWQRAGLKSKFKSRRAVAIPRQRANSCQGAS